jgi:hypothetical protein
MISAHHSGQPSKWMSPQMPGPAAARFFPLARSEALHEGKESTELKNLHNLKVRIELICDYKNLHSEPTVPFPFWKGTSRLRGEKTAPCSGFLEGGRKEWAHRNAAFPLIWAEIRRFCGNIGDREKT